MNEATLIRSIEIVLSALTVTIGFSLFSGGGQKRLRRFSYVLLFIGILTVMVSTGWMQEGLLGVAVPAILISALYIALFRENFLNLVVILLFALTPYFLLIPLGIQLLALIIPSQTMASLVAHISILVLYLVVKIIILFINPKEHISPMINISALIFANVLIYATWYAALGKSAVSGEPISMVTHITAVACSIALNGLIIMNFIKTESKLESLKEYDEIKMTVSPLIESNIGLQEGFAKHLRSLKQHIDGSDKKANAYIDGIIMSIEEESEFSRWKKPVVGALMIRKKQEAYGKGMRLETEADGNQMQFPVPEYLLIPVLTHMIDCAADWVECLHLKTRRMVLYIEGGEQLNIRIVGGDMKKGREQGHKNRLNSRCRNRLIELKRLVKETKGITKAAVLPDGFEINVYYHEMNEAAG